MVVSFFNENTERLLLENDSSVTVLAFCSSIDIVEAPSRLGTALRGNTHVRWLFLLLQNSEEGDDFTGTIQFVEESAGLEGLSVRNGRDRLAPLVGRLLHAAARNPSIKTCDLYNTTILAHSLASLLQASSIDNLHNLMHFLRGALPSDEAAAQLITGAFASNTSLQRLDLDWTATNGQFVQGILRALSGHSKLQILGIGNITGHDVDTIAASTALVELLGSPTCPLKQLEFQQCEWDEMSFMAIAGCLRSSAKVSQISLYQCKFDEASSLLLASIFQSNDAKELILNESVFPDKTNVLGSLVESSSHLSALDMTHYNRLRNSSNGLEAILSGLRAKMSKVGTVLLPSLTSYQCTLLLASLPTLRSLKRLECILDADSERKRDRLKVRLLKAFYLNGSIIDSNGVQVPFLDETDRAKLRSYARRNEMLAPTIKSAIATAITSNSSEINIVPHLLRLSLTATGAAGPNDVYCALAHLNGRIRNNNSLTIMHQNERGLPLPFLTKKCHRREMIDSS